MRRRMRRRTRKRRRRSRLVPDRRRESTRIMGRAASAEVREGKGPEVGLGRYDRERRDTFGAVVMMGEGGWGCW